MFLTKNKTNSIFLSYKDCKIWIKNNLSANSFNSFYDWKKIADNLPYFIPDNPRLYYRKFWISWEDFLGLETISTFYNYEDAKKWVDENLDLNEINTKSKWINNNHSLPNFIPKAPQNFYKFIGWVSWYEWLNK